MGWLIHLADSVLYQGNVTAQSKKLLKLLFAQISTNPQ
jgi:hypothetical protein